MDNLAPEKDSTTSRSRLVAAARELFYEQGYAATTLAQISTKSGVNNGLITYYFGTKSKLALEIYNLFLLNIRNEIAQQLFTRKKGYSMELDIALETRLLLALKFKNANLLQFCNEYQKDSELFVSPNDLRERYYGLQKQLINPNISDIDLKLYSVCGIAVTRGITAAYEKKYLDCDINYLKDYVTRTLFTMLQLQPDRVEALIEESRYWEEKLKIKVGPNFELTTY